MCVSEHAVEPHSCIAPGVSNRVEPRCHERRSAVKPLTQQTPRNLATSRLRIGTNVKHNRSCHAPSQGQHDLVSDAQPGPHTDSRTQCFATSKPGGNHCIGPDVSHQPVCVTPIACGRQMDDEEARKRPMIEGCGCSYFLCLQGVHRCAKPVSCACSLIDALLHQYGTDSLQAIRTTRLRHSCRTDPNRTHLCQDLQLCIFLDNTQHDRLVAYTADQLSCGLRTDRSACIRHTAPGPAAAVHQSRAAGTHGAPHALLIWLEKPVQRL